MDKPEIEGFFDPATGSWSYVVAVNRACAVIDPVLDFDIHAGHTSTSGADKIIAYIREQGLSCEWIIETHIHADHLTAMPHMQKAVGGKTGITAKVIDSLKLWAPVFDLDAPMDGSQFDVLFSEADGFTIGGETVRVMHTPGHTPADTTFVIGDAAFVGDALLMPDQGTGRCDFPGGSAADSWNSIQKIFELPDQTRVYVAHDYPTSHQEPHCMATIAQHKAHNIRVKTGTTRDHYVQNRMADDKGKPVPKLIIPALQVNLRAGELPASLNFPLNRL